jgi:isoleucyl-tRNA synthetase
MFKPVDGNVNFPDEELAVGRFWKERRIYEKSLEQRAGAPPFVFYEGPPTANGMPHPGHCLTRAIKDLFPRYHTMRGRFCERKAGWDTHGLPVEVEVCKELGIHSKEEIEAYGIEPFIQKCQQSVWRYMQEWRRLTERIGFWVDLDAAYVTYHQSYVESVWWSLKNLFDRGLLYQGHKIVWWWAQGGTALSAGEVGQGYRQVADPSVYVKFPLLDDAGNVTDTSLLVWTTTPWTLPSNQFVAVNPELTYATVIDVEDGSKIIVAEALVEAISAKIKRPLIVESVYSGVDLVDRRYGPPFDYYFKLFGNHCGHLIELEDTSFEFVLFSGLHEIGYRGTTTYQPLSHFQEIARSKSEEWNAWRVVAAAFVTTESGTGVVHQAPAFGEVDFAVLTVERERFAEGEGPELINSVRPDGKFNEAAPEFCRDRWVKDCDKDIIRDLKQRGLLFHQEQYVHDYPFCWRAEEDPLIQYPRESWFINTTESMFEMLENNARINWLPEHIKDGRFGNFLRSNVDWALSRERYWGTPLPIWKCDKTGQMEAVASYDELLAKPGLVGQHVWQDAKQKNPDLADDLQVHKPYIDAITYDSPFAAGARMHRVHEVIDCWYDSGAMPFAQWGYPNVPGSDLRFDAQFPADFISEALDQTRGWFYSQLAISTLMFGPGTSPSPTDTIFPGTSQISRLPDPKPQSPTPFPHPFRNCIVLGLMLGEDGQKMSKSKRNYLAPDEIFDRYGADALRWYFFANQPPWTSIRYSEQAIKDSIPEFLLRLWNCYSFFVIYANIDGFDPAEGFKVQGSGFSKADSASLAACVFATAPTYRPVGTRSELDRWILSELHRTCAAVVERMDAYDNFAACAHITEFVDALSNWYVRRSRDRFWAADKRATEKLDAYWTLYECLVTTAKLIAPFVPFLAETLWQNLAGVYNQNSPPSQGGARGGFGESVAESVHLCDYPTGDSAAIDIDLSERMKLVRLIASLGRAARTSAQLKVRQPLAKVEVILADTKHQAWLEQHSVVIEEELNVKQVEFSDDPALYVEHDVNPNFKLLGPKLGKLLPKVKKWLSEQSGAELLANIRDNGLIDLVIDGQPIALTREEVEVRIRPKPGWTAANDRGVVVVLSTELTPDLVAEGTARDVVRLIQDCRKDIGCEYTDRIEVGLATESTELESAIAKHRDFIAQETLAKTLVVKPLDQVEPTSAKVGSDDLTLYVRVVK